MTLRRYAWGLPLPMELCGRCGNWLQGMQAHEIRAIGPCAVDVDYLATHVIDSHHGPCALHCYQCKPSAQHVACELDPNRMVEAQVLAAVPRWVPRPDRGPVEDRPCPSLWPPREAPRRAALQVMTEQAAPGHGDLSWLRDPRFSGQTMAEIPEANKAEIYAAALCPPEARGPLPTAFERRAAKEVGRAFHAAGMYLPPGGRPRRRSQSPRIHSRAPSPRRQSPCRGHSPAPRSRGRSPSGRRAAAASDWDTPVDPDPNSWANSGAQPFYPPACAASMASSRGRGGPATGPCPGPGAGAIPGGSSFGPAETRGQIAPARLETPAGPGATEDSAAGLGQTGSWSGAGQGAAGSARGRGRADQNSAGPLPSPW